MTFRISQLRLPVLGASLILAVAMPTAFAAPGGGSATKASSAAARPAPTSSTPPSRPVSSRPSPPR